MTDYKEEQNNEIEALESIYPDEFESISHKPLHKFKILVKSEAFDDDEPECGASISLQFEYTPHYPDELPIVEVNPLHNIEDDQLEELREQLILQCEENLGMVMVFTLVSYSLEWINTYLEEQERKAIEELERKKKAQEEIERKKFEGTRVTVESFLAWKAKFDAERGIISSDKDSDKNRRLTGKELFLTDNTLNVSDLSFLGEGDAEVAVDESLFQDLEDLDMEDADADDDDDEDYIPGKDDLSD